MNSDRHEFIVKTNKDVDAWMDGFYTDGHKADFRLHCQWAWQEQERRHNAVEAELLEALKNAREMLNRNLPTLDRNVGFCPNIVAATVGTISSIDATISKAKGLTQ